MVHIVNIFYLLFVAGNFIADGSTDIFYKESKRTIKTFSETPLVQIDSFSKIRISQNLNFWNVF